MSEISDGSGRDLRIAKVVQHWLERRNSAETAPTVDALLAEHPDLAPDLRDCLDAATWIEAAASGFSCEPDPVPPAADPDCQYPTIPDFEILGQLGRGGMGVVYEARQRSLDRTVALKVLPIGTVDPHGVERFTREAETAATLHHTNIVPIFAVGRHQGLHWYAMQRIDGESLARRVGACGRPLPVADCLSIGIHAAEALAHAHGHGVIHRDVKPGNLLLDQEGRVWLTDFGLARREVDVTATATGAVVGTPRYMSPEQIGGGNDAVDHRSDIYSLGATLYELATGVPVFDAETPLQLLEKIRGDDPVPPRQRCRQVPRDLEIVLLKCLDKDPKRRYASADALADDLRAIRDHRSITARGMPGWLRAARTWKRHERPFRWAAVAVLGTFAVLAAAGLLWRQQQSATTGRLQISAARGPYVASRLSAGRDAAAEPARFTVPMQQPMTVPSGEHEIRLSGHGRFGETARVYVAPTRFTKVRYVDRRPEPPSIDLTDKLAIPFNDSKLAVLGHDEFSIYNEQGKLRFRLDTDTIVAGLPGSSDEQSDPPQFGFDPEAGFSGDWNVPNSPFARPPRVVAGEIDVEGDGMPDLVLVASDATALAAIGHGGQVRWCRDFSLPLPEQVAPPHGKPLLPLRRFVHVASAEDLNGDARKDLVATAVHVDGAGTVRPFVLTIDGATGSELSTIPLPEIDAANVRRWPNSGKLLFHRSPLDETRRISHWISDGSGGYVRQTSSRSHEVYWAGGAIHSRLPVPTPMRLVRLDDRPLGVLAASREILIVDLERGELTDASVTLPSVLADGPIEAGLGGDERGLLVVSGGDANKTPSRLSMIRIGDPTPVWTTSLASDRTPPQPTSSKRDLPLVSDLDGDGVDEIIFARPADTIRGMPTLACVDAKTGKSTWTHNPIILGIARLPERCSVMGDLNGDGARDLAVSGIAAQRSAAGGGVDAAVYVDVISGRDGRLIGWQSESLPPMSHRPSVSEVDAAVADPESGTLEVSVVYGGGREAELSSATVRFDLRGKESRATALGLTRLTIGDPIRGEGVAVSSGYYRRRPGPDRLEGESAEWLDGASATHWLAANQVLSIYQRGEERSAAADTMLLADSASLFAVDPLERHTLWRRDDLADRQGRVWKLPRPDGRTDLLVQRQRPLTANPVLLDGSTGGQRLAFDQLDTGPWVDVGVSGQAPGKTIYAVAEVDHRGGPRPGTTGGRGFWLMRIERKSGRVVWRRKVATSLSIPRPVYKPPRPVEIDADGDRTPDLVFGDCSGPGIVLKAFGGIDGEMLWSTPLRHRLRHWPHERRWPLVRKVGSPDLFRERLVVLDTAAGQSSFALRMIDPATGRQIDEATIPGNTDSIAHDAGRPDRFELAVLSTSGEVPVVGVFLPRRTDDRQPGGSWNVFRAEPQGFSPMYEGKAEPYQRLAVVHVDADGGDPERILVRDDRVECRDVFSDNVRWRWRADRGWDHSGQIERAGDRVYLSGGKRRELFAWLDLQNGTIAHILSRRHQRWETDNLSFPTLVAAHGATTMIGKTRDGVYATGLTSRPAPDEERGLSNLALNPHSSDPRRVRPVPALGRPVDAERFAAIPNSILLSLLGLILPLSYVWLPIRRRRCSLRWLMLAPAVVLLTLYAWRWLMIESDTPLLAVMQLLGGTVACLGLLGLAQIIANRRWRLLSGTVAAAAAATLAILYAVYLDHEGRYPHLRFYVAPSDAAVTFAVATVNFSCVVLAARLMAARLRGTHARRSTGSHARSPTTAAT